MKSLMFALTLILSINVYTQNEFENINIFIRIYDSHSKKINKGKILSISETSIQLKRKGETVNIPASNISFIKTKRSPGNNVLVGAAVGATVSAIVGAASAEPDTIVLDYTATEGATIGAIGGGIAGAAIGGITVLFKNSRTYAINGDDLKLREFKDLILK